MLRRLGFDVMPAVKRKPPKKDRKSPPPKPMFITGTVKKEEDIDMFWSTVRDAPRTIGTTGP